MVYTLVIILGYQPDFVISILKCVEKGGVRVRLIDTSEIVVNNGAQSHCGTRASKTRCSSEE